MRPGPSWWRAPQDPELGAGAGGGGGGLGAEGRGPLPLDPVPEPDETDPEEPDETEEPDDPVEREAVEEAVEEPLLTGPPAPIVVLVAMTVRVSTTVLTGCLFHTVRTCRGWAACHAACCRRQSACAARSASFRAVSFAACSAWKSSEAAPASHPQAVSTPTVVSPVSTDKAWR